MTKIQMTETAPPPLIPACGGTGSGGRGVGETRDFNQPDLSTTALAKYRKSRSLSSVVDFIKLHFIDVLDPVRSVDPLGHQAEGKAVLFREVFPVYLIG